MVAFEMCYVSLMSTYAAMHMLLLMTSAVVLRVTHC